ncbi:MAG TPA: CdaR family protein [Candidatus Gracilibacteria bacterium]|nr:CdaR family protein [Candidatus Gracilibacteria bacterium]
MNPTRTNKTYLRILALLAAVILWFIVITIENSVYALPEAVKVKSLNLEKNLNLSADLPEVKLYVGVERDSVASMTANDFDVYVDLKDIGPGEHTVRIIAKSKNVKARVLKTEPAELKLKLAPVAEKEVDVVVKVKGLPAADSVVEETKAEFPKARVSGAQEVLDRITSIEAELVLDGTQRDNVSQTVTLRLSAEANVSRNIVEINPEQMLVTATIVSALEKKEVPVIPVFLRQEDNEAWQKSLTAYPATIWIQGKESDLENIVDVKTVPLEMSVLNRDGSTDAGLALPEGITTVTPDQKVKVTLVIRDVPESEFLNVEPTI